MRKGKRAGLARIGILAIALMIVFGAMGVVYCVWSDTVTINTTVEPGCVETSLGCSDNPPVYCDAFGMTLDITVTATTENPTPAGRYSCDFDIENSGSLLVKIQSIEIPDLPGVHVSTTGVVEDTQIDPGPSVEGTVNIILDEDITENLNFTVTFNVVLWNE